MIVSNSTTTSQSPGCRYLITGATGDVGARVVDLLMRSGQRPRVLVRDEQKARSRFRDGVEVRVGDLEDEDSLQASLHGMDGLFLVNIGPRIPVRDELAARVAKTSGVKHIVKLSSMDVQHGLAIGAWHEQGEAAIRASGVPFTFVQPTGFMSNLLAWAPAIKAEGVVRASTGDGRRAFIHSEDIAAVAVMALTSRAYDGESLPITGPEALSFAEVTARTDCVRSAHGERGSIPMIQPTMGRSRMLLLWNTPNSRGHSEDYPECVSEPDCAWQTGFPEKIRLRFERG